ncbi:MAG: cytochrome c biogenesis protein CcdA, partial [Candidatus Jorgensenbacteria bacterium]
LKIPDAAHSKMAVLMEKASLPAAFALGAFVALCEFPCTGGPYLMVLGLLHDTRTYLSGFGYLILYNLIFIAPLVLILGIAANETLLTKVQTWRKENIRGMHLWGGLAMVLLGLLIFVL